MPISHVETSPDSFKSYPDLLTVSSGTPQSVLKRSTLLASDIVIKGLITAPNLSPSAPCFVTLPYWFSVFIGHVHELARRGQMLETTPLRLDYVNVLEAMVSFANSTWTPQQWETFQGCSCESHDTAEMRRFRDDFPPMQIPFRDTVSNIFSILADIASDIIAFTDYDKPIKIEKKISKKLVKWPSSLSQLVPHGPQTAISAFATWARRIAHPAPLDALCRLARHCPDLKSAVSQNEELVPLATSLFSNFITSFQRFQPKKLTKHRVDLLQRDVAHFMSTFGFRSFWIGHLAKAMTDETAASLLVSTHDDICTLLTIIDKYLPPSPGIQGIKEVYANTAINIYGAISPSLHPVLAPYRQESTRIHHSATMFVSKIAMLRGQQKCAQPSCALTSKNDLKRCAACQVVRYCSKACQVGDWKEHKQVCKPLKAIIPQVMAYLPNSPDHRGPIYKNDPTAWFHSKAAEAGVTNEDLDCIGTYAQLRIDSTNHPPVS